MAKSGIKHSGYLSVFFCFGRFKRAVFATLAPRSWYCGRVGAILDDLKYVRFVRIYNLYQFTNSFVMKCLPLCVCTTRSRIIYMLFLVLTIAECAMQLLL